MEHKKHDSTLYGASKIRCKKIITTPKKVNNNNFIVGTVGDGKRHNIQERRKEYIKMNIGERIRTIRKNKGITQLRLAELAGIHPVSIRKYETGKMQPQIFQIEKIAKALKVSPTKIAGWEQSNMNKRRLWLIYFNDDCLMDISTNVVVECEDRVATILGEQIERYIFENAYRADKTKSMVAFNFDTNEFELNKYLIDPNEDYGVGKEIILSAPTEYYFCLQEPSLIVDAAKKHKVEYLRYDARGDYGWVSKEDFVKCMYDVSKSHLKKNKRNYVMFESIAYFFEKE